MSAITLAQIISAVIVIILILLQEKSSGLGGLFGGDSSGEFYSRRRGFEKAAFILTFVFIAIFIGLLILQLVI